MSNKRLQQLFVARESIPGSLVSGLVAAANAKIRIKDPVMTATVETYDREILYGSLSALTPLVGKVEMDISFGVELAGSTITNEADTTLAALPPVWAPLMEACGFRQAVLHSAIFGGTVAGVFGGTASGTAKVAKHGDIWQTTAAAKTIRIIHDTYEGQGFVFFERVVGVPATADVFWPAASTLAVGPTITLGAGQPLSVKGHAWYPVSDSILSFTQTALTGTQALGDIYKGVTSGAVLQAQQATIDGTLQRFRLIDGVPVPDELLTNLSQVASSLTLGPDPAFFVEQIPSLSIALSQDGRIISAKGCRGTVKLSGERGKPMFLDFNFKGAFAAAINGGSVPGVTYQSKVPPRFQGIGFLLQSYVVGEPGYFLHTSAHTPRLVSASFDIGAGANLQEDATQAGGTGGVAFLTSVRKAQGAMKIDVRPEASWPVINKLVGSQPFAIKMRIADPGNASNNVFLVSSPGCKKTGAAPADTNNFLQDDVAFTMSAMNPDGSDGDQRELVISYHYANGSTW